MISAKEMHERTVEAEQKLFDKWCNLLCEEIDAEIEKASDDGKYHTEVVMNPHYPKSVHTRAVQEYKEQGYSVCLFDGNKRVNNPTYMSISW